MTEHEQPWQIILARQPETALRRLSLAVFRLIDRKILALAKNPTPLEAQPLSGHLHLYRLRVGEWRIAYAIEPEDRRVLILEIVPKQQPERYLLELDDEPEGEERLAAPTLPPELYEFLAANLTTPESLAELVRNLEQLKRPTAQQVEGQDQPASHPPDSSTPVEVTGSEKIRLFIEVYSISLRGGLYELLRPEADIEFVAEPTAADIILTEMALPKAISENVLPKAIFGPAIPTDRTMIRVQDLANYLTLSAGAPELLLLPLSRDELLPAIRRVYRLSVEQDAMSRALKTFNTLSLGHWLELSLSVADLAASLAFYEKLGLRQVDGGQEPYPWAIVSDETLHLGLHQRAFPSPVLNYFSWGDTLARRVNILKKLDLPFDRITTQGVAYGPLGDNQITTAEFTSPEGQRICLANFMRDMQQPQRSLFVTGSQSFGELSLRTADVNASLDYWKQIGFKRVAGGDRPYPWAAVSDGLIRLSFHQTPKVARPTITCFSPGMPGQLKHLQSQGLTFLTEHKDRQGQLTGAVIESPDGQRFCLFTGEIKPTRQERYPAEPMRRSPLDTAAPGLTTSFEVGQKVRILAGPFADFIGTVHEVDPNQARLKVQIPFFGQEKLIGVDFLQVEPG